MNKEELATLLNKLQGELASAQPVDEGLRQQLQALDRDIQIALSRPGEPVALASGAQGDASLEERAQAIEARFASEHPYLASTLRDVMDTLGKMGI